MAQVGEPVLYTEEPEHQLDAANIGILGRSPWQIFWSRFRKDRWALVGGIVVICMVVIAFAAPLASLVTGHGPNDLFVYETTTSQGFAPEKAGPSAQFWFGADTSFRDLFVRVMYGARTSLTIAFLATAMELAIGITFGVAAGFYRGKTDTIISRASDVVLSLPVLLLALGIAASCGTTKEGCFGGLIKPGLLLVAIIIGLFSWPYIARIIRGEVFSMREREFVQASRAMGATNRQIMVKEILPNLAAPIIVYTTLLIPTNILFEAALSFLGVGVPDTIPSWGSMLSESVGTYTYAPWLLIFPGFFLLATTLGFNLVGDGLRDALDPRTAVSVS